LLRHERRQLGPATLEWGHLAAFEMLIEDVSTWEALLGACLETLTGEGLPFVSLHGDVGRFGPIGFAPYHMATELVLPTRPVGPCVYLRPAQPDDLDDLAALYEHSYVRVPLHQVRSRAEWRWLLAEANSFRVLEDSLGRVLGYIRVAPGQPVAEAAAADAGIARSLLEALPPHTGRDGQRLSLPLAHPVAQAALHRGGVAQVRAPTAQGTAVVPLAGVVDVGEALRQLLPAFTVRLAQSRYAGWQGLVQLELAEERWGLACGNGQLRVVEGNSSADVRLRQLSLAGLAQLLLGYRAPADLRATGDLSCDDTALGLLDALFPVIL
jgi:hypothetical protein